MTLLNEADAIYRGDQAVDKVFLDEVQVWPPFLGAQIRKSADQTAANYTAGVMVSWAQADFDSSGFFSAGAPTRITIPAALNGYYVVLSAMVQVDAVSGGPLCSIDIRKGGSVFAQGAGCRRLPGVGVNGSATTMWLECYTHAVQVATGDYFEVRLQVETDTSITVSAAQSCFAIRVIGSAYRGAIVRNLADKTTQNLSGFPTLTWNTDDYDPDGWHDTGVNTDRFTCPVALNGRYIVVRATIRSTLINASQGSALWITKNALSSPHATFQMTTVSNDSWISIESPPIQMATGDYVTVNGYCQDTSITITAVGTMYSLEVLPVSFQGVLAKLNVDALGNYTTSTALAFNGTDTYDTDAVHDPSSSPGNAKIIISSAWNEKYVLFYGGATGLSDMTINGTVSCGIFKANSSAFNGFGGSGGHNSTLQGPWTSCRSQIVLVATGEEYTFKYWNATDTTVTLESDTTHFGAYVLN